MKNMKFALLLASALLGVNGISTNMVFATAPTATSNAQAKDYASAYTTIFNKMKEGMNNAPYTGNISLDFVEEMMPHHKGGIEMAKAIIKYGSNPEVNKIAEHIVTSQEAQMPIMMKLKAAFEKEPLSDKEQAKKYIQEYDKIKTEMFEEMQDVSLTEAPDEVFLEQMIDHHEGAIDMAKLVLKYTKNPELKKLAKNIVSTQSKGVKEMEKLLDTIAPD